MAQNSLKVDDVRVTAERQIPLEVADDSFYSKKNMDELERRVDNIRTGKSVLKEHDLIENFGPMSEIYTMDKVKLKQKSNQPYI